MCEKVKIVDTSADNICNFGFCGFKSIKQEGYRRKAEWLKKRFSEGMKFKVLHTPDEGTVGFIEYIPGNYAWRPIEPTFRTSPRPSQEFPDRVAFVFA
jgi:hypothetical protein